MVSKSFFAKIGYVGRKNCFIIHIPVAVVKKLNLKLGQFIKTILIQDDTKN